VTLISEGDSDSLASTTGDPSKMVIQLLTWEVEAVVVA